MKFWISAEYLLFSYVLLRILVSALAVCTPVPRRVVRADSIPETRWGLGLTVAARPELNFNSFSVVSCAYLGSSELRLKSADSSTLPENQFIWVASWDLRWPCAYRTSAF